MAPNKNTNTRKHKKSNAATCRVCGRNFKDSRAVSQHLRSVHDGQRGPLRSGRRANNVVLPDNRDPVALYKAPANNGTGFRSSSVLRNRIEPLARMAQSDYGAQYVRRYLHPCDEARPGPVKIPDNVDEKSAAIEHRLYTVINAPPAATNNWDLQLLSLPFAEMPLVQRTRPSGGQWSYWHPVALNNNMPCGVTTLGKADNLSGKISEYPAVESRPKLLDTCDGFRFVARGLTLDLNANALSNEGFIMAGMWGGKPDTKEMQMYDHPPILGKDGNPVSAVLVNPQQVYVFKDIPEEPTELMSKVPGALEWKATSGLYMTMRYEDPIHPYTAPSTQTFSAGSTNDHVGGVPVLLNETIENGSGDIQTTPDFVYTLGSNPSTTRQLATVSGPFNQMIGCVIFSGLNKSASIVAKTISDFEVIPTSTDNLSSVASSSANLDNTAISMTKEIGVNLPMGFPSKYNNLGLIMSVIKPLVVPALKAVAPMAIDLIDKGLNPRVSGRATMRS